MWCACSISIKHVVRASESNADSATSLAVHQLNLVHAGRIFEAKRDVRQTICLEKLRVVQPGQQPQGAGQYRAQRVIQQLDH